jgi:hypothetical protein
MHSLSTVPLDLFLASFLGSLFVAILGALALVILAGWLMHSAAAHDPELVDHLDRYGPGGRLIAGAPDRGADLQRPAAAPAPGSDRFHFHGSISANERRELAAQGGQEAPGSLPRPSLARSPCRFCARVRDALKRVQNRLQGPS